ncbi:MAG: DUF1311 domain-containing protein [Lachnospiraceae bacterium]|nr:DUF1311 domain-containing protein [Lachnospiraceae bacterium]
MKKKIIAAMMLGAAMVFAGCGSNGANDSAKNTTESAAEVESEVQTEVGTESQTEAESEKVEDSTEKTTESGAETAEVPSTLTFEDLKLKEFTFSSGAGGWSTYLHIDKDGSFTGSYGDSDMGDVGEGYEYGVYYYCDFTGHFEEPVKVNDYTYSLKIKDFSTGDKTEPEIIDGIKYIPSGPYGMENTDEVLIYLPGTPISELPTEFVEWVSMPMAANYEESDTIDFYGLYNPVEKDGFFSYDGEDPDPYKLDEFFENTYASVDDELAAVEEKAKEIEDALGEDSTQYELNMNAMWLATVWDKELNSLWGRLKETLPESEMTALTAEEKEWITKKDAAVEEEGAIYEGGSIQPLIMDTKRAELTEERVKYLAEILKSY